MIIYGIFKEILTFLFICFFLFPLNIIIITLIIITNVNFLSIIPIHFLKLKLFRIIYLFLDKNKYISKNKLYNKNKLYKIKINYTSISV